MFRRISIVLVLALLASGCTAMKAYEGPELPKSEISVIDKFYGHSWTVFMMGILPIPMTHRHDTTVLEVDGQQPRGGIIGSYHVRPGQHTAKVFYIGRGPVTLFGGVREFETRAILTINFITEAGHEYRIPAERRDERDWIWVEDVTTGKVVAGERPPDDKAKEKDPATPPEQP